MIKGIDVSDWQGKINWDEVKANTGFAILRCGYGDDIASQDDKRYQEYVAEAERVGIPYGVYLYSYVDSETHLQSEIAHTLRLVSGHKPFCVYLDLEGQIFKQGKEKLTDYAKRWCWAIQNAGYKAGVYASSSWFDKYIDIYQIYNAGYSVWVAQYSSKQPRWNGVNYDIWQYASDGSCAGINGRVDMNNLYNTALLGQYNIKGFLDTADKTTASGWAYNGVNDTPVSVHICAAIGDSEEQTFLGAVTADEYRPDLLAARVGNGHHGFTYHYDLAQYGEGVYTIRAYGVVGETVKELSGEMYVTITDDDLPKPEPEPTPEPPAEEPTPTPDEPTDDNTGEGILATLKKLIRLIIEWAFGGKDNED